MSNSAPTSREEEVLADLLTRTSRTFALAIPCLPAETRRAVTVAYLLFRIADTIEDGLYLDRTEKLECLGRFARLISAAQQAPSENVSLEFPRPPSDNAADLALLDELPFVLHACRGLSEEVNASMVAGIQTSVAGMQSFIAAGSSAGRVRIDSVDELRRYCYIVAGVVGEMLTEIFCSHAPWLSAVRPQLERNARWFGEGLQLVNILKDSDDDLGDGKRFIPADANLFVLAREDLSKAEAYVRALRQAEAPAGFLAFTELPLQLASRTLECVERFGPGSKVPRDEVLRILARMSLPDADQPHPRITAK